MLKSAIELKQAINSIPHKMDRIGYCPIVAKFGYEDSKYIDDEEIKNEIPDQNWSWKLAQDINEILSGENSDLFFDSSIEHNNSEHNDSEHNDYSLLVPQLGLEKTLTELTFDDIKNMHFIAKESQFGNVATLSNEIDHNVRKAKELTYDQFEVSKSLIDKLVQEWKENMYPKNVRVEPYKINFYDVGGQFKPHKDTPEKNLVGTILIVLAKEKIKGGELVLYPDGVETSLENIDLALYGFYPDIVHTVKPVEEGLRTTISFKVYARIDDGDIIKAPSSMDDMIYGVVEDYFATIIEEGGYSSKQDILRHCNFAKIGIVLGFEYNLDGPLKGKDWLLHDILQKKYKCTVIPIFINEHREYTDEETLTSYCNVYPLTEDYISYVLGKTEQPKGIFPDDDIYFYHFGNDLGNKWESNSVPYAAYTGNECRPGEVNSIYIHKALIVEFDQPI